MWASCLGHQNVARELLKANASIIASPTTEKVRMLHLSLMFQINSFEV